MAAPHIYNVDKKFDANQTQYKHQIHNGNQSHALY